MKRTMLLFPVVALAAACSEDPMTSDPYAQIDPYYVDWDALPADFITVDETWGSYGTAISTKFIRYDRLTRDTTTILQVNNVSGQSILIAPDGSNFYFTGYGGSVYRAGMSPPAGPVLVQSPPSGSQNAIVNVIGWTAAGGLVCQMAWSTYDPVQGYRSFTAITIDGSIKVYDAMTPVYVLSGTSRIIFQRPDDGIHVLGIYEYNADNGVVRTLLTRSSTLVTNLYPANDYSIGVKGGFLSKGGYLVEISNWSYINTSETFLLDTTLTTLTRTQLPSNVTWVTLASDDEVVGYLKTYLSYPPFANRLLFYILKCPLSGGEPKMLLRSEGYDSFAFLPP